MQGEIIKSFLMGLGFDVDESSLAAFNKSIQTAALRVTALYGSVNAFAGSMVYAFSKISEGFEEMGYQYHIIAPAINKAIVLRNELLKAYSAAGINIRKTIVDSVRLNFSLTKTKFAIEAIYKSVGSKFFGLLQKQSDAFRKNLYQNMPYIIHSLETLVTVVFKAFDIAIQLGERVWSILGRIYGFFKDLNDATNGWSTAVIGAIAVWKLLNLSFIATPLGAVITAFTLLLSLFDDYKTYTEHRKSFFNWGPAIPTINAVAAALSGVKDLLVDIAKLTYHNLFKLDDWDQLKHDLGAIAAAFEKIDAAVTSLVRALGGGKVSAALGFRDKIGNSVSGFFKSIFGGGGADSSSFSPLSDVLSNFKNPNLGDSAFQRSPLGLGSNKVTNLTATYQTNVNVAGSPNAEAVGRSTAYHVTNMNLDLTQNLKGLIR